VPALSPQEAEQQVTIPVELAVSGLPGLKNVRSVSSSASRKYVLMTRPVSTGYRARQLYERLNDRQIDKVFDIMQSTGIVDALLETDDLSFDWHSQAILRLILDSSRRMSHNVRHETGSLTIRLDKDLHQLLTESQ
jgi:hypothetical protein